MSHIYEFVLSINVRPQNVPDFLKITARINRLAPEIAVLGRPADYHESMIPDELRSIPRLTIYLVNSPPVLDTRGHTLFVSKIDKYEQHKRFTQHGVSTPKTVVYSPGQKVDVDTWGQRAILKPAGDSYGRGVFLVPTADLNSPQGIGSLESAIGNKRYLLQEWIDPGPWIEIYRVLVFLGEPLLCYRATGTVPLKPPQTIEEALEANLFEAGKRDRLLIKDEEVIQLAQKGATANPYQPLQGIDICRDHQSGKLYVLENNAGGNVWSFSRKEGSIYKKYGSGPLIRQFNAFSKSADLLINATRTLAHSELNV